jgi:hypothetical protein
MGIAGKEVATQQGEKNQVASSEAKIHTEPTLSFEEIFIRVVHRVGIENIHTPHAQKLIQELLHGNIGASLKPAGGLEEMTIRGRSEQPGGYESQPESQPRGINGGVGLDTAKGGFSKDMGTDKASLADNRRQQKEELELRRAAVSKENARRKAFIVEIKRRLHAVKFMPESAAQSHLVNIANDLQVEIKAAISRGSLTDKKNMVSMLTEIGSGAAKRPIKEQSKFLTRSTVALEKSFEPKVKKATRVLSRVAMLLGLLGAADYAAADAVDDSQVNGTVDFGEFIDVFNTIETGGEALGEAYQTYMQRTGGSDLPVMTPEEFEEAATGTPKPTETPEFTATPDGFTLPEAPSVWNETTREESLVEITAENEDDVLAAYGKEYPELVKQFGGDVKRFVENADLKIGFYDPMLRLFLTPDGKPISPTLGASTAKDAEKSLQEIDADNMHRFVMEGGALGRIIFTQPASELTGRSELFGFNENIYSDPQWQKAFMKSLKDAFEEIEPGSWVDGRTIIVQMTPDDLTTGAPADRGLGGGGVRPFASGTDAFGYTELLDKDENVIFVRFSMSKSRLQEDLDSPDGFAYNTSGELITAIAYAYGLVDQTSIIEIWKSVLSNVNYNVAQQAGPIEPLIVSYSD